MAQFIAYPKAFSLLADRLVATQDEMAVWIFLGPENGGLAAYLNANELNPPPRFHYSLGNEGDFDYLSPLMACWFLETDIANFQPEEHYITGKTLIKRWSKQPGIQPQAFIGAKIAESRLFDMHPLFGCTRFSGSGDDTFPPLESRLFALSNVEAIEAEDFGRTTSQQGEIRPSITREYPPGMLIKFEEFLFYLTIDPFYGVKATNSKQIVEEIYTSKKNNALYEQFRNRFSRRPFKSDKQRELIYLWCGFMSLPIYQNGSVTSWRHEDFSTPWLEDIQLKLNEIQYFLLDQSMPLPIKLFSNNNSQSRNAPLTKTTSKDASHPLSVFRTMENLRFKEIRIRIDPDRISLRISARGINATVPFNAIGIMKKNEVSLNKQGEILMSLANGTYIHNLTNPPRALARLSKALRTAFDTADPPFQNGAPQFHISIPKDNEAKQRAVKRTCQYNENRAIPNNGTTAQEFFRTCDPEYNHDEDLYSDNLDFKGDV